MRPFSVSVSPGSTWRRNFAPSMPVRNPMEPSAPRSTRMQNDAACASASMMMTPGKTGCPGKCPANSASSGSTSSSAVTSTPGSHATMRLTQQNGSRCGSTASTTSLPQGYSMSMVRLLPTYARYGETAKLALWPPNPSEFDSATF